MRNLTHRIEQLERRTEASQQEGMLVVIDTMPPARMTSDEIIDVNKIRRGLSNDRCIEILRECGYFRGADVSVVELGRIPRGLSAADTERFLREHGDQVCGPVGERMIRGISGNQK
jgi:hypothetical protein